MLEGARTGWLRAVPRVVRNSKRFCAMNALRPFQRRLRGLNVPTVSLLALVQRTPVVRVAIATEEFVLASPIGVVLKSVVATVASLGAVHSLAGATQLSTTSPSPFAATVGTPATIGFSITGTLSEPETWTVSGTVPPGMTFQGGSTSGTINSATIVEPRIRRPGSRR